jgi:cyclophilin family peptidyl-prolyl cis-trans isomerase
MKGVVHTARVAVVLAAMQGLGWPDTALAQARATGRQGATPPAGRAAAPARGRQGAPAPATVKRSSGAGPLVTVETTRGSFTFETYPTEAPKSVEHILALVKRNFYNGQRISRVAPGFVVQFGDPLSRDLSKKDIWNTGGSFQIVGELEASPKRTHTIGAVALAHDGDARRSDSIMYITMREAHELDGKYNVIGHILSGMPILRATQVGDLIRRVSVTP